MIGLQIKDSFLPIGTSDFFSSFFYTIHYHLCGDEWGDRFPLIMKELYRGKLRIKDVSKAKEELKKIQSELIEFKPSQIIWDIEDLEAKPPWGDNISKQITNLSNYFVTEDGKDMIEVIFKAFNRSIEMEWDVVVRNMFLRPDMQPQADQLKDTKD